MADHDCGKEREFGEITTTLKFFQAAEERREAREGEMISTMKQIAGQGEAIRALAAGQERHEKAFGIVFERILKLETPGHNRKEGQERAKESFVIQIYKSKAGPYVLAFLIAGFLVGVGTNIEAVTKITLKLIAD